MQQNKKNISKKNKLIINFEKKSTLFLLLLITLFYSTYSVFAQSSKPALPNSNKSSYEQSPKAYSQDLLRSLFFMESDLLHGIDFAGLNSLKQKSLDFAQNKTQKVSTDSNKKNYLKLNETSDGDRIQVCLRLESYDTKISINVFNMLGKKVLDVYDGYAINGVECPEKYEIQKSKLPTGVFLCVVVWQKGRLIEKFYISR